MQRGGSVPPIVKELARGSVTRNPAWGRAFHLFTYVATLGAGVFAMSCIPEKDMRGNDHVLSEFYRWRIRTRDAFLGVEKVELELKSKEGETKMIKE